MAGSFFTTEPPGKLSVSWRVASYLLIYIIHPKVWRFPDSGVIVSAPRLWLQQTSLLKVMQGQDVLIAIGLQEKSSQENGFCDFQKGALPTNPLVSTLEHVTEIQALTVHGRRAGQDGSLS